MPTEVSDEDVIVAMETFGGGFIKALARAFRAADSENQARIKLAFADYWSGYTEMSQRSRKLS